MRYLFILKFGVFISGFMTFANSLEVFQNFSEIPGHENCFCSKVQGIIEDCNISTDNVELFNQRRIYPILTSLLDKPYFRFYKVNLAHQCPFWKSDWQCSSSNCHVKGCDSNVLPLALRDEPSRTPGEAPQPAPPQSPAKPLCEVDASSSQHAVASGNHPLSALDATISEQSREALESWALFDDEELKFCEYDDDLSSDMQYVDLTLNPERFTGYSGPSAAQIWRAIYEENCFKLDARVLREPTPSTPDGLPDGAASSLSAGRVLSDSNRTRRSRSLLPRALDTILRVYRTMLKNDTCNEKRIFYRIVSGLHTSISLHLCKQWPRQIGSQGASFAGVDWTWEPNLGEFERRFQPTRNRDGPSFLRNVYFLYLVYVRALAKATPYLLEEQFYTGDESDDEDTRSAVAALLKHVKELGSGFTESAMFRSESAQHLRAEFREHFKNITRIMDCVMCDKCRMWGKLQSQGLATALKILFAMPDPNHSDADPDACCTPRFQLRRNEIVAFFNAFGRISSSVQSIELFRQLHFAKDARASTSNNAKDDIFSATPAPKGEL